MKELAIFGSTGSIGCSTLNVVRRERDRFAVSILTAGHNLQRLTEQIREFTPRHVYILEKHDAEALREQFPGLDIYWGKDGMEAISRLTDFDIGVSALVGVAGLRPTWNMIQNGKTVALANKEVLVAGGRLVMEAAKECRATLLTVDAAGQELAALELDDQVLDLDAAGRYVAVLTAARLELYTRDLELYASLDTTGGARDVVLRSDGTAWLITGETARLFIPE